MDFASQKSRGRGARRAKSRHGGSSNADKRAGIGRGAVANEARRKAAGAADTANLLPAGRGRGRGRGLEQRPGWNGERSEGEAGGEGGWRSKRSKIPQGSTNAWRYEESDEAGREFERRVEQGEDISRLLLEQSGAAIGAVFPSHPATAGAGELDLCRLAATLSALDPAERLRLDPALFVAGADGVAATASAAASRVSRAAELKAATAATTPPAQQPASRGRGRGSPGAVGGFKAPTGEPAGSSGAGDAPIGRGRGRGRGRGAPLTGGFIPAPAPAARPQSAPAAVKKDTSEVDSFLDSL